MTFLKTWELQKYYSVTFINYDVGIDDIFDANSVLSQQLAYQQELQQATLCYKLCHPHDRTLKNPQPRKKRKIPE